LIKRCEEAITRLRSDKQPFSTKALIVKKKEEIVGHKETIELLRQKCLDINDGKYDSEFVSNKRSDQKNKKTVEKKPVKGAVAPARAFVKGKRPDNDQYLERKMLKDEEYYFKLCSRFPDYLQRNLENMPNNEGYLWRGIWFMGKRPERGVGATVHEKDREGRLLIHEYKHGYYTLYERKGRNKTILKKKAIRSL